MNTPECGKATTQCNELLLPPQQLSSRLATCVSAVVDSALFSFIVEKGDISGGYYLSHTSSYTDACSYFSLITSRW